ncbi:MAG: hypothetical protein AAFN09_00945 [Pseudomonadota bacterium]
MEEDFDWSPYLEDGEEVLWQGRPRRGWFSGDVGQWIVMVLVLVSGLTIANQALAQQRLADWRFFSLFVLHAPLALHERVLRRATRFAITHQRAISLRNTRREPILQKTVLDSWTHAMLTDRLSLRILPDRPPTKRLASKGIIETYLRQLGLYFDGGVMFSPISDAPTALRIAAAQIRAAREREAGDGSG